MPEEKTELKTKPGIGEDFMNLNMDECIRWVLDFLDLESPA
ncbi:hypothetical protein [Methanogenium sp. MK-MG]|nr:hypothetical protein [Methanogenium sp. MK-MG]KAF1077261.1 hypothetical protein MKMG_01302 [Methanogenium sp. MK-MG]